MILGVIIELAVGLICVVFGTLVWKKRKVSLLHDYHYKNVREEDMPAYTRLIGIGLILVGAGICAAGVLSLVFRNLMNLIALGLGLAVGITVMSAAQKKYNGSWLG